MLFLGCTGVCSGVTWKARELIQGTADTRVEEALFLGDLASATTIADEAMAHDPNQSTARLAAARVALALDNPADALEHVSFLQQIGVETEHRSTVQGLAADSWAMQGQHQLEAGALELARTSLGRALEIRDDPAVRVDMSDALLQLDEPDTALEHVIVALLVTPASGRAWLLRVAALDALDRGEEVVAVLEEGWRASGADTVAVALAQRLSAEGDHSAAANVLTLQLDRSPHAAPVHAARLVVHAAAKDWDAVEDAHRTRVSAFPEDGGMCLELVSYLETRRRSTDTLKSETEACLDRPVDDPDAHGLTRVWLRHNGSDHRSRPRERKAGLEDALLFLEAQHRAHSERAFINELTAETLYDAGEKEQAFSLAETGRTARPQDPSPAVLLARLHELDGNPDEARQTLAQFAAGGLTSPDVLAAAVGLEVRSKDYEAARSLIHRAEEDGMPIDALGPVAERLRLSEDLYSCVEIGSGRVSTEDVQLYTNLAYVMDGSYAPSAFTGSSVKRGWVANRCQFTPVSVSVTLTFKVKETTRAFIFTETRTRTKHHRVTLSDIAPGEVRSFRGSVATSSQDLGLLGAVSKDVQSVSVSARLRGSHFDIRGED